MTDTLAVTPAAITEPCVIDDMDEAVYHSDPVAGGSLSSGGARTLLEAGGPAKFHHWRGIQRNSTTFDLGKAAHTAALGNGAAIELVDAPDWRSKDAREAQARAYTNGTTPILVKDYRRVTAMVDALKAHPVAGPILAADGPTEQSLFWTDPDTGVWCRARTDKAIRDNNGRLVIVDLKTCESASEQAISKSVATYQYHQQDQWYRRAAMALGLDDDPGFVFVFVEKTAPHLVHVTQLAADDVAVGKARNNEALRRYAKCTQTGVWPGHSNDITEISLPTYYPRQEF